MKVVDNAPEEPGMAGFLYFRDDQALATEWHLEPPTRGGVSFGWDEDLDQGLRETMLRVIWPESEGGLQWSYSDAYSKSRENALAVVPELRDKLETLPATATISEFVAILEAAGFVNARKNLPSR